MEPSDSPLREPIEYQDEYERALHIEDALRQHNRAVELLLGAQRDRDTASDPQYDGIIRKLQTLERESGERLARDRE